MSDDTNSDKEGAGETTESDPSSGSSTVSEASILEAIKALSLDVCSLKKIIAERVNATLSGSIISNEESGEETVPVSPGGSTSNNQNDEDHDEIAAVNALLLLTQEKVARE